MQDFQYFEESNQFETWQEYCERYVHSYSVKIIFSPENDLRVYFELLLENNFADIRAVLGWRATNIL